MAGSPAIGKMPANWSAALATWITDDVAAGLQAIDCLIDFTRPEGTLVHLELCRQAGVGMVIGTTGFVADGKGPSPRRRGYSGCFRPEHGGWRQCGLQAARWRRAS